MRRGLGIRKGIGYVLELLDLNFPLREHGLDLELPTHRLNKAAQRRHIHICTLLHLRHRPLIDPKNAGEVSLRQAASFPKLIQGYRLCAGLDILDRKSTRLNSSHANISYA